MKKDRYTKVSDRVSYYLNRGEKKQAAKFMVWLTLYRHKYRPKR